MASSISSITQRPNSNKWYITGTQSFEEPRNLKNEAAEPRKLSGAQRFDKFLVEAKPPVGHEDHPSDHLSGLPTNENSVTKDKQAESFNFSKPEPECEDVDKKLEAKFGRERPGETGKPIDNQVNLWGEEDHVENEKTPLWGKTDLGLGAPQQLPPQPTVPQRLQHQTSLPYHPIQHFPAHKKDFHPALKHCASTEDNGRRASYDLHAGNVTNGIYGSPKPQAKTFKKKVSPFYTQAQQQKSHLAGYAGNQQASQASQHQAPSHQVSMPSVPFQDFLSALMKTKNCGFRPFACVSKNPTTDKWFYIDEKGGVQGGFTPEEMDTWYNLSYFGMELLIAMNDKSCFKPLRVYLEIAAKVAYDLYFNVKATGSAGASQTSGNTSGRELMTQRSLPFPESIPTKVPQRSFAPSDSL